MGYKVSVFIGAGNVVKAAEDRLRAVSDQTFGSKDEITKALREVRAIRLSWSVSGDTELFLNCEVPLARIEAI